MNLKKSKHPETSLNRREFLGQSLLAVAGAYILGLSIKTGNGLAQSPTGRRPFVIHIHLGSWEGYSAGLMMPTSPNNYPKGVFFRNQARPHPNPNVNVHYQDGDLVFNDYTKVLQPIAQHMLFTVANPQSLAHDQAFLIQQTGSRLEGASKSPSWAAGFAQATGGANSSSYVLYDRAMRSGVGLAQTTPDVTSITAATITAAKQMYQDPQNIPGQSVAPESERYAAIGKSAYWSSPNLSVLSSNEKQSAAAAIDALRRGIPGADAVQQEIEAFMERPGLDTKFTDVPDKEAVMWIDDAGNVMGRNATNLSRRGLPTLHDKLKLAALLIETQMASGIHINMPNIHDYHGGGSHVRTARAACQVWAQITQFWEWVISKGYQNDVLVIVGNEFNRTPANASSQRINGVVTKDAPAGVSVESPGTDHHLSCGLVFINGKLPPKSRLGYIGDTFVPTGGRLNQGPAPGVAPYTSLQLVTSVFMRVFPGVFSDYRAVREIWQPIKESDIINELLS